MRIAALYDIHGNLPALEAVLAEVEGADVDEVIAGGDIWPGPMANDCLDRLRRLTPPVHFIVGNGDREVLAARTGAMSPVIPDYYRAAMQWNADQLSDADAALIGSWPLTLRRHVDGIGDVLFCHATPRNDTEIMVETTADEKLRPIFDPLNVSLIVCGHTHMQFDRMVGPTRLVNAGSIGMPFQEPAAYWLLLDRGVELRVTRYDLQIAAGRVRQTAYPQAESFAATNILTAPAAAAMLAAMATAELT